MVFSLRRKERREEFLGKDENEEAVVFVEEGDNLKS